MSKCRSCQADIVWGITEAGKRMPLDPFPVARPGAVLAAHRDDGADPRTAPATLAVRSIEADDVLAANEKPARSHYATCPNADQHRRR